MTATRRPHGSSNRASTRPRCSPAAAPSRTSSFASPAANSSNRSDMTTRPSMRYLEHELVVYRRLWRSSIASSFLAPMLFLAALGGTLGHAIDKRDGGGLGGVSYLVWL